MSNFKIVKKEDVPVFRPGAKTGKWDALHKAIVGLVGKDDVIVVKTESLGEMRSLQALVNRWGRREGGNAPWKLPKGYITRTRSQRVDTANKMAGRELYIWVEELNEDAN